MIYLSDEMGDCAICLRTDEQLQIDTEMCLVCYSAYVEGQREIRDYVLDILSKHVDPAIVEWRDKLAKAIESNYAGL